MSRGPGVTKFSSLPGSFFAEFFAGNQKKHSGFQGLPALQNNIVTGRCFRKTAEK
jgi:hypothetical protein